MKLAIYIEGGGNTSEQRGMLREGFQGFLREIRDAAQAKGLGSKIILCGSRDEAIDAYKDAREHDQDTINVLLVDSDGPVSSMPARHLNSQRHRANELLDNHEVHLMVQVMETWLVADPRGLTEYYGQGLHEGALPNATDLETVAKADVIHALNRATAKTTKGQYHKIRHARDLLTKVNPQLVRHRCGHCRQFFSSVLDLIDRVQQ